MPSPSCLDNVPLRTGDAGSDWSHGQVAAWYDFSLLSNSPPGQHTLVSKCVRIGMGWDGGGGGSAIKWLTCTFLFMMNCLHTPISYKPRNKTCPPPPPLLFTFVPPFVALSSTYFLKKVLANISVPPPLQSLVLIFALMCPPLSSCFYLSKPITCTETEVLSS